VTFVEVLGRRGDVVQRVRLDRLPAVIGRGYQCDVIVGDPLVDPQHARLSANEAGELALEDLGSVNGLYADGARQRALRVVVSGLTTARIGRTLIRIVPEGAAVAPALRDTESGDRLSVLLASPRWSATLLVVLGLLSALWLWLGSYEKSAAAVAGGGVLALAMLTAAWAGFWALIGRANVQRFSFWPHFTLTWLFLGAAGTVSLAASWATFLFPDDGITVVAVVLGLVLGAGLFARHLALATLLPRRRRNGIAALATAGLVLVVMVVGRLASDELDGGTVPVSALVKPVPARLMPATDLETFLRSGDDLKKELDGLPDLP